MWIDRVLELTPRERLVAIKNVTSGEEPLQTHFASDSVRGLAPSPTLPASLVFEGMAQTAGILVGHAGGFREKVILAKIGRAEIEADVAPGGCLRYTATMSRYDEAGASTEGLIEASDPTDGEGFRTIGRADLVFSHVDRNMAGTMFPEHNFVFGEAFTTLLSVSGIDAASTSV
jgi:3-hydroxyacyl-[acyl-carrier-protein] dehydratase